MKPSWIDVWYDRHYRMWVAALKDDEGNQIGEASYTDKKGCDFTFKSWVEEYNLDVKYIKHKQKEHKEYLKTL